MGSLRKNAFSICGASVWQAVSERIVVCLVLLVALVGTSFSAGKGAPGVSGPKAAPIPAIRLDGVTFQETQKNRTEYSGIATSAAYYDDQRTGIVVDPRLNGELREGVSFTASSDSAFYDDSKKLITLKDNIAADLNNDYDVRCELMDYLIADKVLIARAPVTVTGKDLQLYADRGRIDLPEDKLTMQGNIRAKIYHMSLK